MPLLKELANRSAEMDRVLDKFAALQSEMSESHRNPRDRGSSMRRSSSTGAIDQLRYAGASMMKGTVASLRPPKQLKIVENYTRSEYQFGALVNDSPNATVKFSPGLNGLVVNGAQIVQSSAQAWMKGVRPGWSVTNVAGIAITQDNEDQVELMLERAEAGDQKYEVSFKKGRAKFGTGVAQLSKIELEKEENTNRLRKTFRYQGAIERMEYRAVTYAQLERLLGYAAEYCHNWKDQAPPEISPFSGKSLNLDIFNFNHAHAWITGPATERRKCSFVELLSSHRQVPKCCIIHYWGNPLVDFMKCMKAHMSARGLTVDTPYWMSVFALRHQSAAQDPFPDDKRQSIFYKALSTCQGQTLLVLGMAGKAFRRTWCAYEASMCLGHASANFDMAVCQQSKARLLTTGLTVQEEVLEKQTKCAGVAAKVERELDFPMEVAQMGLNFEIDKCECNNEQERKKILNSIAGQPLDAELLEEHPAYEETNKRLQAYFAGHLLRRAATMADADSDAGRELWRRLITASRSDVWRKTVDWSLDGMSSQGLQLVLQCLPPSLEDLTLRLRASTVSDDDVVELAETLTAHPRMRGEGIPEGTKRVVSLDFRNSEEVGDGIGDDVWIAAFQRLGATGVQLNLDYTAFAAVDGGEDSTSKAMGTAMQMNLVREGVPLKLYQRKVVPAVPALCKILATDDNPRSRKAAAKALGGLGQAALDAVQALQTAEMEDLEPSVQRAAAEARARVTGASE